MSFSPGGFSSKQHGCCVVILLGRMPLVWSGTEREEASRGVEGGGNERPLVAGMDAQRNLAWMPGL
jgi:hypothetical protein